MVFMETLSALKCQNLRGCTVIRLVIILRLCCVHPRGDMAKVVV